MYKIIYTISIFYKTSILLNVNLRWKNNNLESLDAEYWYSSPNKAYSNL